MSMGVRLNTNGWGLFLNLGRAVSYSKQRFYQIEFVEFKHPKEQKQASDYGFSGLGYPPKPFVFGKQNTFHALHFGFGNRVFIGDKAEKSGVEVNFTYLIGPSLGLLKPYYLDVIVSTEDGGVDTEAFRYDGFNDSIFLSRESIYGASGFSKGLKEIKFRPGIHAKAGFNFDWSDYNDRIRAVEVGLAADVYPKRIPIMIEERNDPYFIYLYLAIQFGKRW